MASENILIIFELIFTDGESSDKHQRFSVPAMSGNTLFEALTSYEKTNAGFSIETMHAPNVGHYVVKVKNTKNKSSHFWETLLLNQRNDVIPINLDYQVQSGDKVYLQYTPFVFSSGCCPRK